MRHGAEWYKREPIAYLGGVQGLSTREHAVLSIVLDLIYQHGGSVNDDPAWIAGWISDMGAAATRRTIDSLVDRGKLIRENGQLTQKRAKSEALTRQNLRENRAESGRKGGFISGKSRAEHSKYSDLDEPSASPRVEEKSRDIGGGSRAHACATTSLLPSMPLRERVLSACGVDPVSGLIGYGGSRIGTQADMAELDRWKHDLGLSEDQIAIEVADVMARKDDGPPSTLTFFRRPMQRLAGRLAAPPLKPAPLKSSKGSRYGQSEQRRREDEATGELIRRIDQGTLERGPDPSDPFSGG